MIIYELSKFHDPQALESWSAANMRFQKYMVVNEKMSPPFVIPEELVFVQIHVFTRQQRFAAAGSLP